MEKTNSLSWVQYHLQYYSCISFSILDHINHVTVFQLFNVEHVTNILLVNRLTHHLLVKRKRPIRNWCGAVETNLVLKDAFHQSVQKEKYIVMRNLLSVLEKKRVQLFHAQCGKEKWSMKVNQYKIIDQNVNNGMCFLCKFNLSNFYECGPFHGQ